MLGIAVGVEIEPNWSSKTTKKASVEELNTMKMKEQKEEGKGTLLDRQRRSRGLLCGFTSEQFRLSKSFIDLVLSSLIPQSA